LFSQVPNHRQLKRRRYQLRTVLCIIALATLYGYSGHRAIASFAAKLTQKQRRRLRCYRNRCTGQYDVPKETCIRQILYKLDPEAVENVVARWMEGLDETELRCIAIDGKTLKGTAKRDENGQRYRNLPILFSSSAIVAVLVVRLPDTRHRETHTRVWPSRCGHQTLTSGTRPRKACSTLN